MKASDDLKELVERSQQGDISAFGRIYELLFEKVYAYVYRQVGTRIETEDITSTVFLNAFEKIGGFTWLGAGFNAWIFRIAHNSVIDYYRRKGKPVSEVDVADELLEHPDAVDVEVQIDKSWKEEQLHAAIDDLPDEQKQVVLLRLMMNFSNREIGEVLSKSEGAVKGLQHRALVNLRKNLMDSGTTDD